MIPPNFASIVRRVLEKRDATLPDAEVERIAAGADEIYARNPVLFDYDTLAYLNREIGAIVGRRD